MSLLTRLANRATPSPAPRPPTPAGAAPEEVVEDPARSLPAPATEPVSGRGLPLDARVLALVPHHACEAWLEHCLASLVAQTRPLDGIVVIDDASAEPPAHIVARFPGVTLLTAASNVGPYRLVQQVIDRTDADAYLFQDADDWSAPDRLERLLLASSRTGAELLGSDYVMLTSDEATTIHHAFPLDVNATLSASPTSHALQHPTSLVSRRLVAELGGYSSGMRFSGDDEFLRRAAHVTRVVNVPRPLYYRRHRADSLTTAAGTGHGSPARRQVLNALADRARTNVAVAAAGAAPDLDPFATSGLVDLRHVCGPTLDALPARTARTAPPVPATPRPAAPPVFVLGGAASGADALVLSLGQHPQVAPVPTSDWLVPFVQAAQSITGTSVDGHVAPGADRHLGPLDVLGRRERDLLDALAGAAHRLLLGGEPARPAGGEDLTQVLQAVATTALTAEDRWVATLPADDAVIVAALRLFPDAAVVHLVRDADEVAAALARRSRSNPRPCNESDGYRAWLRDERVCLSAEQLAGAGRVTRLSFTDLVERPDEVVRRCLELAGLDFDEACARPLRTLELTGPAASEETGGHISLARDLSTALLGAPRSATPLPSLQATPTPAAALPQTAGATAATTGAPTPRPPGSKRSTDTVDGPLALLRAALPTGAVVAVVTKGESAFVEAEGIEGWHFPQDEHGDWAGYHPGSTEEVIDHLAQLHDRGARYFFVPAWALWWLDHYVGLSGFLARAGRVVARSPSGGVLHDLGTGPIPRRRRNVEEEPTPPVPDRAGTDRSGAGPVLPLPSTNGHAPATNGHAPASAAGAPPATDGHAPAAASAPAAPPASAPSSRPVAVPAVPGRRRSVSVVSWNTTHNPLGRAHLLAEVLARDYDVELVGGRFREFGEDVWAPHAASSVPLRSYEGGRFPDLLQRMEEMAATITSDVVLVSKPRLPSLGLGILAKTARNRPLVLDVDDWELSFVKAERGLTLDQLREKVDNDVLRNPYGRLWTQYCESVIADADAITVSNQVLGDRYGGTVIPHARDERLFDPARYDRDRVRASLGFEPDEHIILFGGTPRRHKGVVDVARALHQIGDPRLQLCLIGTAEYHELRATLEPYEAHIRVVPYQPFDELPALLSAADMVCVLQDEHSAVSDYQIPAKVTDALAMQLPCLVRPVPPLRPLVGAHLETFEGDDLAGRIQELLDDHGAVSARARANRELFLERYSYAAVRPVLGAVVEASLDGLAPAPASFHEVVAFQREVFPPAGPPAPLRAAPVVVRDVPHPADEPDFRTAGGGTGRTAPDGGFDVVLLWKQNDTGIYGRRHDMLMAQLAASPSVHQVVQLDTPTTLSALAVPAGDSPHHAALVRERTLARRDGVEPVPGLHQHTYVHDGEGPPRGTPWGDDHLRYVEGVLARHDVGRRPTVLWVYPKSFDFAGIAGLVRPDLVVADVVDDNTTWADPDSPYARAITENYEEILRAADVVLVNCERMRVQMAPLATGEVHLVPNGCELPGSEGDLGGPPPELVGRGPVVGYVGNLSSRIDVDLLDRAARERPDWHIVLIGSAHAGREVLRLADHPNVSLLGPKPYEEAKRYVRHFDVGIIPHLDNPMTRAMNPLKAFVYASLGVPVVSTAVAGLDELAPLIAVAVDADGFLAEVDAAILRGRRPLTAEALALLRANSWEERIGRILELVVGRLPVGAGAR